MISDFLRRRSLNKTADMLGMELEMDLNHAFMGLSHQLPVLLRSPVGFLADWFVVFWELFISRNLRQKQAAPSSTTPSPNNLSPPNMGMPYIRTSDQEASVKKLLLQRLMGSMGMGNRDISTLSPDERRWLSHLMQRYSSAHVLPPLPLSPTLSNSPPPPMNYGQQQQQQQMRPPVGNHNMKRPKKEGVKRDRGESIDDFLIPGALSPDELMASLVQGNSVQQPTVEPAASCDLVFRKELMALNEKLSCCAYSADGGELAVGLRNGNLISMREAACNAEGYHAGPITQLRWYKQSMLASASLDRCVKIRHTSEGVNRIQTFSGHNAPVYSIEFINRSTLASSDGDGVIKFWNIDTSECLKELVLTAGSSVSARPLRHVKELEMLVVANGDALLFIDDKQLQIQGRIDTKLGKSIICLSLHERCLLVGTVDTISIYTLEKYSASLKASRNLGSSGDKITTAAWVHGRIAVGGWNKIRLFDERLGRELGGVEYAHQGNVAGVCAGDDGMLVSIGHDGLVKQWALKQSEHHPVDINSSVDTLDALFGGINSTS